MIKDYYYYKRLNERFDLRMDQLCKQFKFIGRKEGGDYCFSDYLVKELNLKGSDIMHDSDADFEYKIKFNWQIKR